MPRLNTITITCFERNEAHDAYTSIGGTTIKLMPDGSTREQRAEPVTVATDKLLAASRRLLKPSLDAILAESNANHAAFLAKLEEAKRLAGEAHAEFIKTQRRLFAAATPTPAPGEAPGGRVVVIPDEATPA